MTFTTQLDSADQIIPLSRILKKKTVVSETNGSTGHATLNGDGRQQFRRSGRRRTWWGFAPVAVAGQQPQMKGYYERGSGVNSSAAEASQRGPPAASLGPINTNFPRRFLCCLLPLPIQCMHKPKRELVNIFVGDTAHLRVSGKSVCHFLQDFLTGGSGTGFEKEWIFLKKGFFAL